MRFMIVSRNESCAKTVWVIRKTIQGRASLFFIPHITFIICFGPYALFTTSSHLTLCITGRGAEQ